MHTKNNSYSYLSKTKKIWLNIILIWMFGSSFVLFFVDLFMSSLDPQRSEMGGMDIYSFADSLENQTIWLSVWCGLLLGFFSLFSFISLYVPRFAKWANDKENWTFVLSMLTTMFLIWTPANIEYMVRGTFFDHPPYKYVKGLIDHWLNPIILAIAYFIYAKDLVKESDYAKSKSWFILIFVDAYLAWILAREGLMKAHPELFSKAMKRYPIPYWQFINPMTIGNKKAVPVWQWISCLIAIQFIPYLIELFWNGMSNIAIKNELARRRNRTYLWRTR